MNQLEFIEEKINFLITFQLINTEFTKILVKLNMDKLDDDTKEQYRQLIDRYESNINKLIKYLDEIIKEGNEEKCN